MNALESGGCSGGESTGDLCRSARLGGPYRGAGGMDMERGGWLNTAVPRPLQHADGENSPLERAGLEAQVEEGQWDCSRPYPGSVSST
jgi:hypothetical protein